MVHAVKKFLRPKIKNNSVIGWGFGALISGLKNITPIFKNYSFSLRGFITDLYMGT